MLGEAGDSQKIAGSGGLDGANSRPNRWFRAVGCVELWIGLSLLFILAIRLTSPNDQGSPLWMLDPLHSGLYLLLMWLPRLGFQPKAWIRSRSMAALAFCLIGWCACMIYELTLSTAEGKFGGMHPTTVGSFVIAQGFYVPLVVGGWWLVRRLQLTWHDLFFVAGMTGSYELAMFGLPYLASAAFFLAPIIVAYYFVVYSRFLSTGLLLVDERLIWSAATRRVSFPFKLLSGLALCLVCWLIFAIWGEIMLRLFNQFQAYP